MMRAMVILALGLGGCERGKAADKATSPTSAPAPAQPPVAVPVPTPPLPGAAKLEVTGAVAWTKQGIGTACGFGKRIGSRDLEGPDARPTWEFWVNESARDATLANAELVVGATTYEWTGPGAAFAPHDGDQPLRFDQELRSAKGATVRVRAELTCPTWPTAPVPAPVAALLATHTGATPRAYATYDFGRARHPGAASVTLPAARAEEALPALRAALPPGYVAFIGTIRFLDEAPPPDDHVELVVAPGASQLDIVRTARTDGVNYGIKTEAIVQQLARWDRAHGLDIRVASTDTVVFTVRTLPADVDAFAREVHAFCPDTVEQGAGTLAALAAHIRERREVTLWWD